jgi:hypothetical protein
MLSECVSRLTTDAQFLLDDLARLEDPLQFSGLVAGLLQGSHERKQRILEIDSVPTRLRRRQSILRRELDLLNLLARPPLVPLERDIISPN